MDITNLLEDDFTYAVISIDGEVLKLSAAARDSFFYKEGETISSSRIDTLMAPWAEIVLDSLSQAKETGYHTEDMWFIDETGKIKRYIHRYQYRPESKVIVVIWFEMKDRLNRLLKSYDRKKARFQIWNGAHITVKELRTIAYYIQGLSYKAIANQENISHATVSARLQAIAQKAGFQSVPALHTALFDELYYDNRLPQLLNMV